MGRWAIMLLLLAAPCASAQVRSVEMQPPQRDFGYFVGDLMDTQAVVTVDAGAELEQSSLPSAGPVSTWVDLRRIAVTQATVGAALRVTIRSQYQSFYDPEEAGRTQVPGYLLSFKSGTKRFDARVPGFSYLASPFRHDLNPIIESSALRGDHPFLTVSLAGAKLRLIASLLVALVAAVLLAAGRGWLPGLRMRGRPFAHASRQVSQLSRQDDEEARVAALLALHRAFDAAAGKRMLAGDLDQFLGGHSAYVPLRADIERFFAASRAMFFGSSPDAAQALTKLPDLVTLGRRLTRAERLS